MMTYACNASNQEAEAKKKIMRLAWSIQQGLASTKEKKMLGKMAHWVKCLPNKHEDLSLDP